MKFPEVNKPETLEKRYLGKLSKKGLTFMKVNYYYKIKASIKYGSHEANNRSLSVIESLFRWHSWWNTSYISVGVKCR